MSTYRIPLGMAQVLSSLMLLGAGWFVVGCRPESSGIADRSQSTLRGNIQIDGSSTVRPIGEAVAKRFSGTHPWVRVDVGGRGTGNGIKRFQLREVDFVHASRPILPREAEQLHGSGIQFLELPVAYDGLTVVVHPENDWVHQLSLEQLQRIFLQVHDSRTWSDVEPDWPPQPIKIFAPGTGSGTYDYFLEVVGGELRSGMSLNEDDNALVTGVSGNKYSIGFFGVAYFNENRQKLKAVPIVNPTDNVAYLPSREAIESNLYYPFSRPLFLYVNSESLNRVEVRTFLRHYIQTVPELVSNVGFVKLPDPIWEHVQEVVEAPSEYYGSRFLDENGQRRIGRFEDLFMDSDFSTRRKTPPAAVRSSPTQVSRL